MALEEFITGRYTAAYGPSNARVSLGISREGYRFSHETRAQNIEGTDAYGDSLIDLIYRGANMSVSFTMMSSRKAVATSILAPWTGDLYLLRSSTSPMGRLASDLAQSLVLTVEANTPAAAVVNPPVAGPATLTCPVVVLAPGSVELLFDSRLREVPIRMIVLPYDTGLIAGNAATNTVRFATVT